MAGMDLMAIGGGGHSSGITKLTRGSDKYIAATNLIAVGVSFDSVSEGRACTILTLKQLHDKDPKYKLPKGEWVDKGKPRLDNQGDINPDRDPKHKYARLAVQISNETNAQANVQINVDFGKRGIRAAMNKSLNSGDVVWLSNNKDFIDRAQALGHSVMTYEMCQALESEEM